MRCALFILFLLTDFCFADFLVLQNEAQTLSGITYHRKVSSYYTPIKMRSDFETSEELKAQSKNWEIRLFNGESLLDCIHGKFSSDCQKVAHPLIPFFFAHLHPNTQVLVNFFSVKNLHFTSSVLNYPCNKFEISYTLTITENGKSKTLDTTGIACFAKLSPRNSLYRYIRNDKKFTDTFDSLFQAEEFKNHHSLYELPLESKTKTTLKNAGEKTVLSIESEITTYSIKEGKAPDELFTPPKEFKLIESP